MTYLHTFKNILDAILLSFEIQRLLITPYTYIFRSSQSLTSVFNLKESLSSNSRLPVVVIHSTIVEAEKTQIEP
jgi:hypothetical protein